jgi:peroxin-1
MDGAEGLEGVYVLAATSRPDLIDPALLRPGRLDKSLLCDMPNREDREDILRAVSSGGRVKMRAEVEKRMVEVSERTEGYSGADLQALMFNASLEAIHELIEAETDGRKSSTGMNGTKGAKPSPRKGSAKSERHEFIQFLYDANEDAKANASLSASSALEPYAAIAAKLDALNLARRREKQLQRGHQLRSHDERRGDSRKDASKEKDEVWVEWKHIQRALATTRSSISADERKRLGAIYHEFIVGRNGEMPSGDGGREIGGRSSLM